jgi:hypothetical protein
LRLRGLKVCGKSARDSLGQFDAVDAVLDLRVLATEVQRAEGILHYPGRFEEH